MASDKGVSWLAKISVDNLVVGIGVVVGTKFGQPTLIDENERFTNGAGKRVDCRVPRAAMRIDPCRLIATVWTDLWKCLARSG